MIHIYNITYRDTHIKLEQPDDEETSIVLRMVDEINDASSSVADIGSELMSGIHDDARDEGGDSDMLTHYGDPLQMPLSDDILPTADTEPSMSSNETQPQVLSDNPLTLCI